MALVGHRGLFLCQLRRLDAKHPVAVKPVSYRLATRKECALQTEKRCCALFLTSFIIAILVISCGLPQETPREVLTFACPGSERPYYERLGQDFEEANPDLQVRVVDLEEVLGTPLSDGQYAGDSALRLASAADTLAISPDPDMVQRGLLRDLTPFIEADRAFDAEDFYPGTLAAPSWDDAIWGLPTSVWSFRVILFDKEAFDSTGVLYPEPGWTWDDFLSTAQAMTERRGDDVVRWGFVERVRDPTPFVHGRVAMMVEPNSDSPVADLDQNAVAEAMRWYTSLILDHQVMPQHAPISRHDNPMATEAAQLVGAGQAAMWSESTLFWVQWSMGRRLGMVPFPVDEPTSATTPVRLNTVVMSAGTAHPEASWRWLAFLSRQIPPGGQLPARSSVAESSGYWEELDPEQEATYRFALSHALSPAKGSLALGFDLYDLQEVLREILAEGQNPAETVAEMQSQDDADREAIEETTPVAVVTAEAKETPAGDVERIVFVPREPAGVYRDLAEEFNEAHPGSIVEIVRDIAGGSTMRTGHELLPILSEEADCFIDVWQTWYPEDQDHLLALDPLVEADVGFLLDDFYAPAMNIVRLEGQLLALPKAILPRVMFFRKAAFDAAQLKHPASGWTLDDFLALARALTEEDGSNRQYGYLGTPDNSDASFFLEQHGAHLVDFSTEPVGYQFDAPATVEAVRWYVALSTEHGIMPEPMFGLLELETFIDAQRSWAAMVESGETAMWSDFPLSTFSLISDARDTSVGMVPMPQGPGQVADFVLETFYISAHTSHPQLCWEWITFLTEQPALFSDAQDGVPPRRSLAASAAYRQQVGDEVATLYQEAIEQSERSGYARLVANRPDVSYPFLWFDDAVQSIIEGEDIETALGEAQRKAEAYVGCLQTKQGVKGNELARACVLEIDPDFNFHGSDE